ncbi:MAG: hypothetical protein GXN94_05490 [Aquificae bacterium]|nr:hypothetical protein [Aquificota bacterium]
MEVYLEGLKQDLIREREDVEKFFKEYSDLNSVLVSDWEGRYDRLLLNYGTEELKQTLGFLTNVYAQIDGKGYTVVNPVFDAVEYWGEFELTVFYGNRILEKYRSGEPEQRLIRIYTLKRMLNALTFLDDRYTYLKYLQTFIGEVLEFIQEYPSFLKEHFRSGIDFYQFMYIYGVQLLSDWERSLGYLIKGYNLKKEMINRQMLPYPEENNIFQIINIVGSYLQVENSFIALIVDVEGYIREFVKQIKDLKEYAYKKPSVLTPYLQNPFKKYINQFLTNIHILGFEEEYKTVAELLPQVITTDHRLVVEINRAVMEMSAERIESIGKEMERAFNNFSEEKKERVLYSYYNGYITLFREDISRIKDIKEKIERDLKKLKKPYSLNVPLFRALNILGERERALKIAQETRRQAVISGRKFLADAIDTYLKTEFDV